MEHAIRASGTSRPMHICLVTDDIEGQAAWLARLFGIDVPTIGAAPPLEVARPCFRGEPTTAGFRQVILRWKDTEIELIEPDDAPSSWRELLDRSGPSVHHIGFGVPDLDATAAELEEQGYAGVHSGSWDSGRYLYLDTSTRLGTFLELLQFDDERAPGLHAAQPK